MVRNRIKKSDNGHPAAEEPRAKPPVGATFQVPLADMTNIRRLLGALTAAKVDLADATMQLEAIRAAQDVALQQTQKAHDQYIQEVRSLVHRLGGDLQADETWHLDNDSATLKRTQ